MAIHVSNKLYRLTVQRPPKQISTRKNTIVASPCHIDRVCRVQHRFLPILFGRLRRIEIIAFKFVAKILSRSNSTKQNGQTKFVAAKLSLQHRREHSGPGGQRQPVSLSRWQFSSRHRRMEWQRNHWQRQCIQKYFRELPSTDHSIATLPQTVSDDATSNQKTIMAMVSAEGNKRQIASDFFRCHDRQNMK